MAGCNQLDFYEEIAPVELTNQQIATRFNVSLQSVRAFVGVLHNGDSTQTKALEKIQPIVHHSDTLLYIVNYKNNKGWLVISGDKRTEAILAYSNEGFFEPEKSNAGVAIWLDDLAEHIYALKQTHEGDTTTADYNLWQIIEAQQCMAAILPPTGDLNIGIGGSGGYWIVDHIVTTPLPTTTKGPLLQTKWGQGSPWNTCVPWMRDYSTRCHTGCVAVAGAQMLYYLHHKWGVPAAMYSTGYCIGWSDNGAYSYQFGFGNPTTTTWDQMALSRNDYGGYTDNVAILMGYVGWSIDMKYKSDGSGADTDDLVGLFSNLGINSIYTGYNSSSVISSLNNNMPIILRAYRTKHDIMFLGIDLGNWYENGHAWVADGYEKRQTKYTYYYHWVENSGNGNGSFDAIMAPAPISYATNSNLNLDISITPIKTEESISTSYYLIMNWGYDGSYDNGRYALNGAWTTQSDRNYQWEREMIINFAKK
jgi:hypothetical protein